MGKVSSPSNFSSVSSWEDLRRFSSALCQDIVNQINGRLSFKDNIQNTEASVFFPLANADVPVNHNLGYVPSSFIVTDLDGAAVIYQTTSPNAGQVFLKSSAAGITAKVRIF